MVGRAQSAKIFCISMQRSGTTSVGDWLQAHGLRRAGWPLSHEHNWTRSWLNGDYESIFASKAFLENDIFEDDPWWCLEAYAVLAGRFPDALFILLERDADDWFKSLCLHSAGRNPGFTDLHCTIYDRKKDLKHLQQIGADVQAWNLLDITDHANHYKRVYLRHNGAVVRYFSRSQHRLFHGRLDDPSLFQQLNAFLGVAHNASMKFPHSNASKKSHHAALQDYISLRRQARDGHCPPSGLMRPIGGVE